MLVLSLICALGAPLRPPSKGSGGTLFHQLDAEDTGLQLVNSIDTTHPLKRLYVGGYASGGLAIGDVDGDGLLDLFASSGPGLNALYLQKRDAQAEPTLQFVDVTGKVPGLDGGNLWAAGAALADIDGDQDLDLYLCHHDAPNQLYLNETQVAGEPVFTECAARFGVAIQDASFMPSFVDYDNDGDLDLFVLGYQFKDPRGRPKVRTDAAGNLIEEPGQYLPLYQDGESFRLKEGEDKYYKIEIEEGASRPTFADSGRPDYLLRNDGNRFTDVTQAAGIGGLGVGNSATWFDFDADGDLDLYIANDFKVADQFYQNNGDGTFTDIVKEAFPHIPWFSMGSDAGDLDGDGMLDLLVSDMAGTSHYRSKVTMGEMANSATFLATANPRQYMRNAVFLNTRTPRFLEAAYLTGLANSDWTWAVKLADYDSDGRVDVFFTNGAARLFNHADHSHTDEDWYGKTEWDLWEDLGERREENLAFRNLGDLKFESIGESWGLGAPSMSYAAAHGDFDNDGDLDLVVANLNEPLAFYRNDSVGKRLKIRLQGADGNKHGLGALVRFRAGSLVQALTVTPASGFLSYNETALNIGLGTVDEIDQLVIDWPNGGTQVVRGLKAGETHTITQEPAAKRLRENLGHPLFAYSSVVPAVQHQETPYDDFAKQPLLPNKLSQLGPGMAVGDIDADGDDDFYLGRGKGGRRAIYTNVGGGKLIVKGLGPFAGAEGFEDMGALFLDVDRDGDQDLYVVSGGVEEPLGSALYQDRLYVNDGQGAFSLATEALPKESDSGSVVVAGDVDRDGDLDLFVGGRSVPGAFPEVPVSRLLENRGEPGKPKFVDVTAERAPGLVETGLVTSALWTDANGDGWLDLFVTHEWGPVRLYLNNKGRLIDRTEEAGLGGALGWWNGIAAGDMDHDGDLDYVTTNFGLNTKYKASRKKPEVLYYGDFDGTGKPHLVEAKMEKDRWVPRRGLSCSSHAMPFVREKLKTFHNFGMANLQEIYSTPKLDQALKLEATVLETGVWIQTGIDGAGVPQFRFRALPRLAQIAPSFGVTLTDFDGDAHVDVFLAQNFDSPQVETGRMAGGLSLWLRGDGKGNFQPIGPRTSGISVRGDAVGVSVVDFNEDHCPDLLVSVNDGPLEAYDNRAKILTKNRFLKVLLSGPPGNPTAVGAAVTLRFADAANHPAQRLEQSLGSGYLSQSTAALFFGYGADAEPQTLEIVWPNGRSSRHNIDVSKGAEVRVVMP